MVKGESGLLAIYPMGEKPVLRGNSLHWANGVEAMIMSASDPDRFRGPQFAAAWCDEVAKWPDAEAAWDMLQFGLRLGDRPRQLATTTPRPTRLLKRLLADPQAAVTRMKTEDNRKHLAPSFLEAVVGRYRGSVLGRQELDGEMIEDLPDALWQRSMFLPADGAAPGRIVVAVDPPVTGNDKSDACGIIVAGRVGEGAVVLEDRTLKPAAPLAWARRAVAAFHAHGADAIVVEVNQGGDLVKSVIAQVDPSGAGAGGAGDAGQMAAGRAGGGALWARAGAACGGAGRAGRRDVRLSAMTGAADGHSPDRVDALVWALTELAAGRCEAAGKGALGEVPRIDQGNVECPEIVDVSRHQYKVMNNGGGGNECIRQFFWLHRAKLRALLDYRQINW